ncbi:MAG: hypothetical protein L0228_06190 [Planctomycetes bacterium]|nr:hypothetical protein [Planctomycetota bacterium]
MSRRLRLDWLSSKHLTRRRSATTRRQAGGSSPFLRRLRVEPLEDRRLLSVSFTGVYAQNFGTLPTSGTSLAWSNDSTLAGWSLFRQPVPGTAITAINAGDGSSSTGSFYSFGSVSSTDRALGGLGSGGAYFGSPASGAVAGWIALALTNDSGLTIDTLSFSYDGEQWRDATTSVQTMVLEYGFGSTFDTVSMWTAPGGGFDFTSPIHAGAIAQLDGNAAANKTFGLGGTLSGLGWAPGSTLWVRWVETNDSGNDHGLAVDNVKVNAGFDYVVDTLVDESDGNYSTGDFSLREAIGLANGMVGTDTISFDPALTSGGPAVITLTSAGELFIVDSVSIQGLGANLLTIKAYDPDMDGTNDGDGSRVFNIDNGGPTRIDVELIGLTLTGGDVFGDGGAIHNAERLTVTSSIISGNAAPGGNGGGISHYISGELTITSSTISGNVAGFNGGGIYHRGTMLDLDNSTISGNTAGYGGGMAHRNKSATLAWTST